MDPVKTPTLAVRPARAEDIPRLVAMNHAAYPELVEANVVWNEAQLRAHLDRFPEGQLVATLDGVPMGAISTFIVPAFSCEPRTRSRISPRSARSTYSCGVRDPRSGDYETLLEWVKPH